MNEYMDCYFTGVTLGYQPTPSQELRLQVTDNRIGSMEDAYGLLPAGIEKPRAPLFYTINWNSSYLDEILNLRYSATAGEQAKGKWMYMAWAGHNVCTGPVDGYFDVMYTRGALDPLGILTELVPQSAENEEGPVSLRNIQYLSLVAEMIYRFHPKWNAFAKRKYETGSDYKAGDEEELPDGKYRTAWGLQTGIEFYPMADENLHIFLTGHSAGGGLVAAGCQLLAGEAGHTPAAVMMEYLPADMATDPVSKLTPEQLADDRERGRAENCSLWGKMESGVMCWHRQGQMCCT